MAIMAVIKVSDMIKYIMKLWSWTEESDNEKLYIECMFMNPYYFYSEVALPACATWESSQGHNRTFIFFFFFLA